MPDGLGVLLPVVIPGLLVGAGFLVDHWWSRRDLAVAGAVVAAVALLVVPGWRLRDVVPLQPQDGAYDGSRGHLRSPSSGCRAPGDRRTDEPRHRETSRPCSRRGV